MKRTYNQPAVQVAQFASMTLMQAASGGTPAGDQMAIDDGETSIQW